MYVHLYRFPGAEECEMKILAAKATEILRYKQSGLKVPPDLWRTHGRFVIEKVIDGERKWIRNDNEIRKAIRYAGCFVIRSNVETNPFKAFGYGDELSWQALCLHISGIAPLDDAPQSTR